MQQALLKLEHPSTQICCYRLEGDWTIQSDFPKNKVIESALETGTQAQTICFNVDALTSWDSRLLIFLQKIIELARDHSVELDLDGLPSGVLDLLKISQTVEERFDARRNHQHEPFLQRLGVWVLDIIASCRQAMTFVGEFVICLMNWLRGKSKFKAQDFFTHLHDCGPKAFGIVALISVLVGLIFAFVGAVQLRMFGAEIYVANLVGLGMFREMGAMMTAVIMSGRTGASYAAQLGAMQANGEIDALQTMGISPMDYLVLPRTLALILVIPLLCIYADLLGIFGGFLVGIFMLDLMPIEYINQTIGALSLNHFFVGIFKAFVFGFLIAFAGCFRGLHSGTSASAVGSATTSAVVTAIILVVIADAILTVIYNALEI
ncbi:MAG: ABC transporter permease [Gammaproteobacteria bacterium]|nr:ABC transporter permease [Gammaproteobacteria bacterium]